LQKKEKKEKVKKNEEKQTTWAQFFTQNSRITKQLKHLQELLLDLTLNWHWDELRNPSILVLALELAQTCWMGILLLLKTINSFPLMQVRTEIIVLLQQYKMLKVQGEVCWLQQSRTSGGWRLGGESLLSTTVKDLLRRLMAQEVCCLQQSRTSSGGWRCRKFAVYNSIQGPLCGSRGDGRWGCRRRRRHLHRCSSSPSNACTRSTSESLSSQCSCIAILGILLMLYLM
jgi:hypothetical protein